MDPEEQQRIDEEARRAEADAETRALEAFARETGAPASHRVELPADPELDHITAGADEPDAFPHDYDSVGARSESVDYGATGQAQMDAYIASLDSPAADRAAHPNDYSLAGFDDAAPGDPPDAETHGTAADTDAIYAGSMRESGARALAQPQGQGQQHGVPESLALEQMTSDAPERGRDHAATRAPVGPSSPSEEMALAQMHQAPTAPRAPTAFERWNAAPSPIAERAAALANPIAAAPPPQPAAASNPAAPAVSAARLDDGLPSESEIAGARDNPVMGFLHSLQNGLRGALGRPARDYGARADELAQERRTGLTQRMAGKATDRRADAAASTTAARQSRQDELAQQGLALRERSVSAQEAMTPARIAQTEAQTAHTQAQTQHTVTVDEIAAGSRADRESPTSALSRGAQNGVEARLALLPESRQRAIREALGGRNISTMSAAELEPVLRSITQGVGIRGTGGGSGGGETVESLAQQYVDHGIARTTEEATATIRALGVQSARARLASRIDEQTVAPARTGDSSGHGRAILPGVYADPELNIGDVEARAIRTDLTHGAQQLSALSRLDEIGQEYGRTGVLSPTAESEAVAARSTMMAMVAQLEGSGIIGPGDLPRIQAAIPNPTDSAQAVLGTMPARIRGFRTAIEDSARRQLLVRGVAEDSIDSAIALLNGRPRARPRPTSTTGAPSSAPAAAPADDTVMMVGPRGGDPRPVRAADVERALAGGYRRAS